MSTSSFSQRIAGLSKILTGIVIVALIIAAVAMYVSRDGKRYVFVEFEQTNSLYKGSDVRILGVPVGVVESMKPKGDVVRVKIAYDGNIKLPSDVKAAIISPSIVGDRFVQLAPAFQGGAALPTNAVIGIERSAVPIELDQVYQSFDDLAVALGPDGANKDGALADFIDSGAKQFDGQGAQLNETIKNFSKLSTTLSNNKDELFGSLEEVETFVAMLRKNDASVRSFNDSTAEVSKVLEGERDDLAGTLKALGLALHDVRTLVKENRKALRGNVDNLTSLSEILVDNRESLEEVATAAPTALSNLGFTYNQKYGSLDTRANLLEAISGGVEDPGALLCALLGETGAPTDTCSILDGILVPLAAAGSSPLPGAEALPLPGGLPLPRSAAASGTGPAPERVHNSVRDMLAVN